MCDIVVIIKIISFTKDISLRLIKNYNQNKMINKIILLNYDLEKTNDFFVKHKNTLDSKTEIYDLFEYNYDLNKITNIFIKQNNLYINSDFNNWILDSKINYLRLIFEEEKCNLIYLNGLELFIDSKYFLNNKITNNEVFAFDHKVKFDDKLNIVNQKDVKYINMEINATHNVCYYLLKNCFKEALFFSILKSQYVAELFNNKKTNDFINYITKQKKCDFKISLNNLFMNNFKSNYSKIISNEINEELKFLPYKINKLIDGYEYNSESKIDLPLVSIIMTVYNKEKYLDSSINSMLKQTYSNIEFILIDDYSTDSSRKILEKYSNIPNVKIILNDKNMGCYYSRNMGIKNSNGEYIGFQDTDDYSISTRIEEQMNFMISNNLLMCGCDMIRTHLKNIDYNNDADILNELNKVKCKSVGGCCKSYFGFPTMIIKKSMFDKWGLYLEKKKGMDMEFPERVIFGEKKFVFGKPNPNNENISSWDFFNNYTYNDEIFFKNIYLKYEKLLVISPQMNNLNLTNNVATDEYLSKRLWRNDYH